MRPTGSKRGIAMDGASIAVIDSYFKDFKANMDGTGGSTLGDRPDTQTCWGYAGPGPYKIVNNHLEAAGRTSCSAARTR